MMNFPFKEKFEMRKSEKDVLMDGRMNKQMSKRETERETEKVR
jgi:hypothetical protein